MRNWNSGLSRCLRSLPVLPDYLWGIETHSLWVALSSCRASRLPMRNWNRSLCIFRSRSYFWLPDYLWGIETKKRKPIWAFALMLPDYLWGIETTIYPLHQKPRVSLPDYLWGIETSLIFPSSNNLLNLASRLPMRNWNSSSSPLLLANTASRLPMRNWNRQSVTGWTQVSGFQTTYEELKLLSVDFDWFTYSFQTTYEELKHAWDFQLLMIHQASRLPMRNWNTRDLGYQIRKQRASRLPMRNWNTGSFFSVSFLIAASRLPMRNWNSRCRHSRWHRCSRFQTTYEELKHSSLKPIQYLYIASRLPMRNWNKAPR